MDADFAHCEMNLKKAIQAVDDLGVCLVFPIDNSTEIPSLWHAFYPKSKMRWEWDSGGDNRVAELWHLREQLSKSGKVVYTKWFKGRATLFSKEVFTALHNLINYSGWELTDLSPHSREICELLDDNSPLSTKQLKRAVNLQGKDFEAAYTRSMKALWDRLLIVGFGEVDDGAFPSLAIGSTKNIFEALWRKSSTSSPAKFDKLLAQLFKDQPAVEKQVKRLQLRLQAPSEPSPVSVLSFRNP